MKKLIESIKTAQRKHVLIFIGIILICIPLTYSAIINLKLGTYEKKSIPFTNNFLKLLVDEKYDELHQKYAINSGIRVIRPHMMVCLEELLVSSFITI